MSIPFSFLPKKQIPLLFQTLAQHIEPKSELNFSSAFELLVAVVLSAQCTDRAVNKVTSVLWQTLHTPQDYIDLGQDKLEGYIRSIGFFHTKAQHIIALCHKLVEKFHGEVPATREELITLPGVGRKTANVVLNVWFGQETLAVDTHIFRVAHRTGLSNGATPENVELDLLKIVPEKYLHDAHHLLLLHGRYTCKARSPQCSQCPLQAVCRKNWMTTEIKYSSLKKNRNSNKESK